MSRRWVVAVLVAGAGAFVGLALVFSDDEGAPVATTFRGAECNAYGDELIVCSPDERWVSVGDGWRRSSFCRPVEPGIEECERPYPLRIDSSGQHPKLEEVPDE